MMGLTRTQLRCLNAIRSWSARNGRAPSYDQLQLAMGLRSKSQVSHTVSRLVERGYLRRVPWRVGKSTIEMVPQRGRQVILNYPDGRRLWRFIPVSELPEESAMGDDNDEQIPTR